VASWWTLTTGALCLYVWSLCPVLAMKLRSIFSSTCVCQRHALKRREKHSGIWSDNTGQQRFCLMRKNVSDVFLDAEFKYVSRISLSPTPFAPGSRVGIFCARTLRCVFTLGAMKNSKISYPRKMLSCFKVMFFFPLWKFLAVNITHISDACSLIRQK